MTRSADTIAFLSCLWVVVSLMVGPVASFSFPPQQHSNSINVGRSTALFAEKDEPAKPKNIFEDLKGMFQNVDDVIDDFVMKRMGAGEQWYGKRKYNPSGRVEGNYNGMGRSSHYSIEIARVQKEVMEERKQRRLEEEAATRKSQ